MSSNLVDRVNHLNDADWAWQPFLFLRPAKTERMSTLRVLLISVLFAVLLAVVSLLLMALGQQLFGAVFMAYPVLILYAVFVVFFFLLFRFLFASCWNKRVEELKQASQTAP